jgi:nitrite reductase/ring-hydroxylating ferredoxin subunit
MMTARALPPEISRNEAATNFLRGRAGTCRSNIRAPPNRSAGNASGAGLRHRSAVSGCLGASLNQALNSARMRGACRLRSQTHFAPAAMVAGEVAMYRPRLSSRHTAQLDYSPTHMQAANVSRAGHATKRRAGNSVRQQQSFINLPGRALPTHGGRPPHAMIWMRNWSPAEKAMVRSFARGLRFKWLGRYRRAWAQEIHRRGLQPDALMITAHIYDQAARLRFDRNRFAGSACTGSAAAAVAQVRRDSWRKMKTAKPDSRNGFPIEQIPDGGQRARACRCRPKRSWCAEEATCLPWARIARTTGPLRKGLVVGDTVALSWHHACFSLRSGEALRAPAIDPIPCWRVSSELEYGVRSAKSFPSRKRIAQATRATCPRRLLIIGGGAAGFAGCGDAPPERLSGPGDYAEAPTIHRPLIGRTCPRISSKRNAQDDWIPQRPAEYYTEQRIDLVLNTRVSSIDLKSRRVRRPRTSKTYDFGATLIATGADPVRPETPTSGDPAILYLRTLRTLVRSSPRPNPRRASWSSAARLSSASKSRRLMRIRGLAVHVVAPDKVPLERVVGPDVGQVVRAVHEEHGVVFHLRENGQPPSMASG